MKKRSSDVALVVGMLVLLASLVDVVLSISSAQGIAPWAGGGMTVGAILMGWGAFGGFDMQEDDGVRLREAVERIRLVQHS